ncbi:MAG: GGDEF domain-containing protein [Methylophaga sp.]|nr:MAG: GGDEF domain-containing protein [Methylophaga sp.]
MPNPSSFPPVYDDEAQKASENLRRALPLLNKHKTPVNPVNYAVWYEYVSGDNQELANVIDNRLSKNQPITAEVTQSLYEKYVLMGMPERLEKTNTGLKIVVDNTLVNITKAESTTDNMLINLSDSQKALESCNSTEELKDLIGTIISNTQIMAESGNELKQELVHSSQEISDLKKELEVVKKLAETDALTGLLNRGTFNNELTDLCRQTAVEAALVMFDLDHFKKINDTFGHLLGDKVIQFFASLLQKHAGDEHLAIRYGGEEMAMIMLDISQREALKIADAIRSSFANSRLKKKGSEDSIGQVTVSVGLTMLRSTDTPQELIERADAALYLSKQNGRNRISVR